MIATNRRLPNTVHLLLDRGKLEAALARPMSTWDGQLWYPTVVQRAAALLDALAMAHAFLDGNKRTAWLSCNIYLNAFESRLCQIPPNEAADFVEGVVVNHYENDVIAAWLTDRLA
ncbi:type II toxin-antitoxin system death-on-curing family toxin [Nocardia sp. BMG51109]|uniref:type II toxin-antitoxin system death-on-curing family toxin n=1 Tax=Nocardia sp. BMG51109 TaxID=1056816 RepID=UPI0018DBADC9|nr:type II toxin-antitoxin system death-on-curing family toxin [Nocardia sp. BMG51109]